MRKVRYAIAFCVGMLLTGMIGGSTLILSVLGSHARAFQRLAHKTPELWGRCILHGVFRLVIGKRLVYEPSEPPPHFDGFTLFICDHPDLDDLPALQGVMGDWGQAPLIVSKEENLRGLIGVFVGRPLKRIRRGVFIPRQDGPAARVILTDGVRDADSLLLFPDKHRRTKETVGNDRTRYADSGLTRHCVPRAGGVFTVLSAVVRSKRPVRVIDLTWSSSNEEMRIRWQDVTTRFIIRHTMGDQVFPEEYLRERLLALWREKEEEDS